jgi:hypothetical protein
MTQVPQTQGQTSMDASFFQNMNPTQLSAWMQTPEGVKALTDNPDLFRQLMSKVRGFNY